MKKLFENVEGNKFRLLTESSEGKYDLVESGLKKVFTNAEDSISYNRVESVGLGYIKDVSEAQRVALDTARRLCESFGFKDDENNAKFVKENDIESVPYNPTDKKEEKREVQIGKEIVRIVDGAYEHVLDDELLNKDFDAIQKLANELIKMHGQ